MSKYTLRFSKKNGMKLRPPHITPIYFSSTPQGMCLPFKPHDKGERQPFSRTQGIKIEMKLLLQSNDKGSLLYFLI